MKKLKLSHFILIGMVIITLFAGIGAAGVWNNYLKTMALNDRIEAQVVANKSSYDNMWKSFVEMAQVTDKQAAQIKDIYQGLIEARYDDPNLLFKAVQEQNPQLDSSVYVKLQQRIESGRKEFNNDQKKIADLVREYNGLVRKHFIMTATTGLRPLNAEDYIVTSAQTKDAFNSGEADTININGDDKK